MVGINNNNYVSSVPPTFGPSYNNNQTGNSQQPQGVNPYQGGDKYSVDNTSQAFDQAMAKLTGQNVFTNQTQPQPQMTTQNTGAPQLPAGVTQSDMNWALSLEEKVKQGYTPTQQETQVYQNIASKLSAAMTNPTGNTQVQTAPQSTQATSNMGISQDELNWALALETKVKGGYTPNQQETQAYQNIAAKMAAAKNTQTQPTQPTAQQNQLPAGVSQQEVQWALDLENKVKGGYTPTQQETQAYQALAAKMSAAQPTSTQPTAQTQQTQLPAGVSQQEIDWALNLETKVKGGYTPNQQEMDTYKNLAAKLSTGNAQQPGATQAKPISQDEVNWALALENKVKGGYTPTPQETATYQDIAHRLQSQQSGGAQNGNRDWSAWSQPFSVPRTLFETTPRIIQVPSTLRASSPTLPTYASVNSGPDLSNVPKTLPTPGSSAPTTTGGAAPSKSEVDWALALEDKVKKGYTPNESELYQYKNIADRLQASQPKTTQQGGGGQDTSKTSIGQRLSNAWSALTK